MKPLAVLIFADIIKCGMVRNSMPSLDCIASENGIDNWLQCQVLS